MKKLIKIVYLILCTNNLSGQAIIKFGEYKIKTSLVDEKTFNIFDTWRVIHREYIIELNNRNEFILLNEQMKSENLKLYLERKKQGELIYGSIVKISKNAFEPFCPYMDPIVINPLIKQTKIKYDVDDHDIFPEMKGQEIIKTELWCSQNTDFLENSPEVYIEVLNENLIKINSNNTYTFLERIINTSKKIEISKKDKFGFYIIKMKGIGDFQILVDSFQKSKDSKLLFLINKKHRNKENYVHISNKNSICENISTENYILKIKDSLTNKISIELSLLKNKIIEVSGITANENEEWEVKWKFTEKLVLIKTNKVYINIVPNSISKNYLLKGDEVEIIEEKTDWLKIRYYGKKIIEGWIKKSDVE